MSTMLRTSERSSTSWSASTLVPTTPSSIGQTSHSLKLVFRWSSFWNYSKRIFKYSSQISVKNIQIGGEIGWSRRIDRVEYSQIWRHPVLNFLTANCWPTSSPSPSSSSPSSSSLKDLQVDMIRRRTPVLLQVYLPSGLFVIVSWISFIVPPEVVPGRTFNPIFYSRTSILSQIHLHFDLSLSFLSEVNNFHFFKSRSLWLIG